MEQYLEEKKASQKRPAATFQRQDKKKTVYQTPQRSVTVSNSQVPFVRSPGVKKECPHCGKTHGGSECWLVAVREQRPQDQGLPKTSAWSANPSSSGSRASYRKTRKASSPSSSVVGDVAPLEETVETDSERED
ncbi:hypothetical protein Taro_011062 [Colocasia esculenta]|uniref:Uncharacterized protein n=1 Tax=Colocasia esculenta TaxID=4460 RepID=A0A843U0L1_COLES|nr:hypothetical protein [Colocasia esculenta]